MKFLYFSAIGLAGIFLLAAGCGSQEHSHEDGSHSHAPAITESLSFIVRSDRSELFVEFPPLIAGEETYFAAHFSGMDNFKAIGEGRLIIRLHDGSRILAVNSVNGPASPGIFRPSLRPPESGEFDLEFLLTTESFSDTLTIPAVGVYTNDHEAAAAHPPEPEGDEVSYLKEQAWKTDFAIEEVKPGPIREVIHTSGIIQTVKGEEKMVTAKNSGILLFKNQKLQAGREVKAGERLFSISSKGLMESNLEEKFHVAKARLDKSMADLDRAEKLYAQQIIGEKEYERRKMEMAVAEAEFRTVSGSNPAGGRSVSASMSGIIKDLKVSNGQFVEEGAPLLTITNTRRLLLEAEVSQIHLPKLAMLNSANFKTPYQEEVQSLDDYNGRLLSYGKAMEEGSSFIPVLFELDNVGGLIPGSFVELFLLTKAVENTLVISRSALMEDYGMHYVYVQTGGESFEKREVSTGVDDGIHVQILSGLTEGEWVVSRGAYQIKMASMSSAIPAHGHSH